MNKTIKTTAMMMSVVMGLGATAGAMAYRPYVDHDGVRHRIVHHDRKVIRHIKKKQERVYFRHLGRAIRADLNGRPGKADRIMRNARHKIHRLNREKKAYHRDVNREKGRYY